MCWFSCLASLNQLPVHIITYRRRYVNFSVGFRRFQDFLCNDLCGAALIPKASLYAVGCTANFNFMPIRRKHLLRVFCTLPGFSNQNHGCGIWDRKKMHRCAAEAPVHFSWQADAATRSAEGPGAAGTRRFQPAARTGRRGGRRWPAYCGSRSRDPRGRIPEAPRT